LDVELLNCIQKKKKYRKVIKDVHKPIPRISRILESGITETIMLPNKGHPTIRRKEMFGYGGWFVILKGMQMIINVHKPS
jgi:hypothetical protein